MLQCGVLLISGIINAYLFLKCNLFNLEFLIFLCGMGG